MTLFTGKSRFFCRVGIETAETEALKAPAETWRKAGAEIVLTENINGSEVGGDGDKAKLGKMNVGIRVCRDDSWVANVVVVIVKCPSKADAACGAVNCFL